MNAAPIVKGWCPGAHRPMLSGDGLVVRVRPFRAQLNPVQVEGLCDLSQRFGNGTLDLTSRGNLQLRGVREADHAAVLQTLDALHLIDRDPSVEGQRNILMPVDWRAGDDTDCLYDALIAALPQLPDLPEKMGFALDTGTEACLRDGSADFRFERDTAGGLMLRADGASLGIPVSVQTAIPALVDLVTWFVETGGPGNKRMARHLQHVALPDRFQRQAPRAIVQGLAPGPYRAGLVLGAPFGKMTAQALRDVMHTSGASALRLTLNRLFVLMGADPVDHSGFVMQPGSPLMAAHACPGAPFCPQASVETQTLAARLAATLPTDVTLHVSGCAKGCALPRAASVTLVGRDGRFDLVNDGAPWDEPRVTGLQPAQITDLTEFA